MKVNEILRNLKKNNENLRNGKENIRNHKESNDILWHITKS